MARDHDRGLVCGATIVHVGFVSVVFGSVLFLFVVLAVFSVLLDRFN